MVITGIDVSHHNGEIDWPAVAAAGHRFVFIKATEGGTFRDPRFATNWRAARAAGLYRGAYHFAAVKDGNLSAGDARTEAKWLCSTVGELSAGDLPVVLDLETYVAGGSGQPIIDWALEFLRTAEELTGRVPIIYCGPNYWKWMLRRTSALQSWPLWQVQYTRAKAPTPMDGWPRWTFWQYSSTGSVPGIRGRVDLNRFAGSHEALAALAGEGPFKTPPSPVAECVDAQHAQLTHTE